MCYASVYIITYNNLPLHQQLKHCSMEQSSNANKDDFEWIHKIKFLKKKTKFSVEGNLNMNSGIATQLNARSALENNTEEGTEDEHKKSKRLKFKSPLSDRVGEVARKEKTNVRFEVTSEDLQSKVNPKMRREVENCKPTRRPLQVFEYGSNSTGYKFIAFDEKEIPAPKPNFIKNEGENYSDESTFPDDDDDSIDSSKLNQKPPPSTYKYDDYLDSWEEIEAGVETGSFPIPVQSNSINDLSRTNVLNFLKKKAIIRQERIRWHPDRMRTILSRCQMWNSSVEKEVTLVFQIVNDTYESV